MPLALYLVEYLGAPRNHHGLFVRPYEGERAGTLFHVTGSIQEGMTYERRDSKPPEESLSFAGMSQLGWVSDLQLIDTICRSNPPPEKQFNGMRRINPKKPLRKCQEWTAETIQLLEQQGALKRENSPEHTSQPSESKATTGGKYSSASSYRGQSSAKSSSKDGQKSSDGYWTWSARSGDWFHVSTDGSTIWAAQQRSRSKGQGRALADMDHPEK